MNIHQLLAGFADGDAISHEAILLQEIFKKWGYRSEIFADKKNVSPGYQSLCHSLNDYAASADDLCLYHYGILSPATEYFLTSPARKILIYHNITPSHFFKGFDDGLAMRLHNARQALPDVARRADAIWADSQYNASELNAIGIKDVNIFPYTVSFKTQNLLPQPSIVKKFSIKLKTILFVGRIAPNKCIENLIYAFAWYHTSINPYSRLVIVGSNRSAPRYYIFLRMLANELNLANICFEGFASAEGLAAYYSIADLYVSTSAHEGYCAPLIEAMYKGIPVIARNIGGVPEAMDGAGILYNNLKPVELAELMNKVLSDKSLRNEVLQLQEKRIQRLKARDISEELKKGLMPFLSSGDARI